MNLPPPPPVDPRIYLAAERTLLAWIRTGIALMGFGLLVAKMRLFLVEILALRGLPVDQAAPVTAGFSDRSGLVLVVLGVAVISAAAIRYHFYVRDLERRGPDVPVRRRFAVLVAAVLAIVGVVLVWNLVQASAALGAGR